MLCAMLMLLISSITTTHADPDIRFLSSNDYQNPSADTNQPVHMRYTNWLKDHRAHQEKKNSGRNYVILLGK